LAQENEMTKKAWLGGLILWLVCGGVLAGDRWIHVRVEDREWDGDQVSIDLPVSLVGALLPHIEGDELGDVQVDFGEEMDGLELREVLQALADTPDMNFVRIRGPEDDVRVAKEDGFLLIHVDDRKGERVRVRMPLAVVEAMVAGDDLDLAAGLEALADYDVDDLVLVESDQESVRIWIDHSETGR